MYEVFDHTADLGLRVTAPDLDSLFAEAGRALFSVIVSDLANVQIRRRVHFQIDGAQPDYLLLDWLNELLFTFESQKLLLSDFRVQVGPEGLRADAGGEPADPERHELDHEVKAITYHGLRVERLQEGWKAEVIVDI